LLVVHNKAEGLLMARYLRDVRLSNISIKEDSIVQIAEVFEARALALQQSADAQEDTDGMPFLTFILRFDDKGCRFFTIEELLHNFHRAKNVERIIFTIETVTSFKTNRTVGDHLELRFDKYDENNNILSVTSDDSDWVDSSFSAVQEILNRCKTNYGWARSTWSALGIQILGVVGGFGLSLWAAARIAKQLSIENAFLITFLFTLLIFSNIWSYISNVVLKYVHQVFPNVQFYRPDKDRVNWFMQAVIGGVAATLAWYILNNVVTYIGEFLSEISN
jgi:hypothetical protein